MSSSRPTSTLTVDTDASEAVAGAAGDESTNNAASKQQQQQPQESTRLTNTTACLPIVYGSVAFFLGRKADEYNTHKWTLYLRGPNHEDLSLVISKVIFQLHPSFAQPVRELTHAPYEVTETGWGEFEAQLRIIWKDNSEKHIVLNHGIKLYPAGSSAASNQQLSAEAPVVAENYDEVVFTNPHEAFYRQLQRISIVPSIPMSDPKLMASLFEYSDHDDFNKLVEAQQFLTKELAATKERLKLVNSEMEQIDDGLLQLQDAKRQAAKQNASRASSSKSASSATGSAAAAAAAMHVSKKQKTG